MSAHPIFILTSPNEQWYPEAFAATGWRVGWLIGPPHIIRPTLAACTRIIFCTNSPLQEAAAAGLEQAKDRKYFEIQAQEYVDRRDVLVRAFDKLGLKYTLPQGSYFILLVSTRHPFSYGFYDAYSWLQDISKLKIPQDFHFPDTLDGRGKDFK